MNENESADDAHYLRAILTAAEAEALRFYERRQTGKTVRWYALIAKILQRHGNSLAIHQFPLFKARPVL